MNARVLSEQIWRELTGEVDGLDSWSWLLLIFLCAYVVGIEIDEIDGLDSWSRRLLIFL